MFVVPESDASKPENRFEFELFGKIHSVPLFKYAPVEAAMLWQQDRNIDGLIACMDDETEAAVRQLNGDQIAALDAAWSEASKVSPGESDGSADS